MSQAKPANANLLGRATAANRTAVVLFVLVLAAMYLLELLLLSYRDSLAMLRAAVPDEAMAFDALEGFERYLDHPLRYSLPSGFPGPYGHPFWFTILAGKRLAMLLSINPVKLLLGLFLLFKYLSAWCTWRTLSARYGHGHAAVMTLAIFLAPLLVFYGKIISPEFMILWLISLGLAALFSDHPRSAQISLAWFFLATYIKLLCLPFLLGSTFIYVVRGGRHGGLKRLGGCIAVLLGTAWLACLIAGGVAVTAKSILALPTPPAIWSPSHLWENMNAHVTYSWDQVLLLALIPGAPCWVAAMLLLALSFILRRRQMLRSDVALPATVMCAASLSLLFLLEAKSLQWSWYLLVPVVALSTSALVWISGIRGNRWLVTGPMAVALLAGIPQAAANIRIEADKRALLLHSLEQSPGLAEQARKFCGQGALVIFDSLIAYDRPETDRDDRTGVLSYQTQLPATRAAIAKAEPFVIISRPRYGTMKKPYSLLWQDFLPPLSERKTASFPDYEFWLSPGCASRPVRQSGGSQDNFE